MDKEHLKSGQIHDAAKGSSNAIHKVLGEKARGLVVCMYLMERIWCMDYLPRVAKDNIEKIK